MPDQPHENTVNDQPESNKRVLAEELDLTPEEDWLLDIANDKFFSEKREREQKQKDDQRAGI